MEAHEDHHENSSHESWFNRHRLLSYGAIAVIGYYLLTEHRQHVFAFLPYLILAACPLMHLFMHHGGHGQHHVKKEEEKKL